jgi:hypothetical protein
MQRRGKEGGRDRVRRRRRRREGGGRKEGRKVKTIGNNDLLKSGSGEQP